MKLIIKSIIVCAVITASIYLTYNKREAAPLLLENIEALASGESGGETSCIGNGSVDCPVFNIKVYRVYTYYSLPHE